MFRTRSSHTIDAKGRLIIPARFRDLLKAGGGDGVVVTGMPGVVKALHSYTFEEWSRIETQILSLPKKSEEMRRFIRFFIGGASECSCDKQGRVLIPPDLRNYAGLKKEIMLVGVLDHFEIWSRENWDNDQKYLEKDMLKEDFKNEIENIGL